MFTPRSSGVASIPLPLRRTKTSQGCSALAVMQNIYLSPWFSLARGGIPVAAGIPLQETRRHLRRSITWCSFFPPLPRPRNSYEVPRAACGRGVRTSVSFCASLRNTSWLRPKSQVVLARGDSRDRKHARAEAGEALLRRMAYFPVRKGFSVGLGDLLGLPWLLECVNMRRILQYS